MRNTEAGQAPQTRAVEQIRARQRDRIIAAVIALAHGAVAWYYAVVAGVSIVADPMRNSWDWFWQLIPLDLLRNDLWRSVWFLHAQPPLFNLLGAVLERAFFPFHLQALHAVNILLGSALSGMLYLILAQLIPRRPLAVTLALVLAMNPSLFLYEAYILYSLPSAFLVVSSVFCLAWYRETKRTFALVCFVSSLNVLILTRSLFHIVLIPVALVGVALLAGAAKRRQLLVLGATICLVAIGWCTKNLVQFGFFGTSSWGGMGLWRIAIEDYHPRKLQDLADEGLLDRMVVERQAFARPSEYIRYGYDEVSSIEVLARDNYNNLNIPDISSVYGRNALRLILHDPIRYTRSVYDAYLIFSRPSSNFKHLPLNAAKIRGHVDFYANVLQGRRVVSAGERDLGSYLFFLLPSAVLFSSIQLLWKLATRASRMQVIREEAVMLWCLALIVYTVLVACSTEYGEQDRFKFLTEQVVWVFVCTCWYRMAGGLRSVLAGRHGLVRNQVLR